MVLIGLIIIIAVLIVLAVPRIWRMLSAGTASRRAGSGSAGYRGGDIVSAFRAPATSRPLTNSPWPGLTMTARHPR